MLVGHSICWRGRLNDWIAKSLGPPTSGTLCFSPSTHLVETREVWATCAPGASLLTFAVLILGIIQIGPSIVLIPLIIWTWMTMTTALLFTAYMVPVNLLDNVLRPLVRGHGLSTPMPVILLVVIGGTISHGITGLFLGPFVLAVFWELLVASLKESETAQ